MWPFDYLLSPKHPVKMQLIPYKMHTNCHLSHDTLVQIACCSVLLSNTTVQNVICEIHPFLPRAVLQSNGIHVPALRI